MFLFDLQVGTLVAHVVHIYHLRHCKPEGVTDIVALNIVLHSLQSLAQVLVPCPNKSVYQPVREPIHHTAHVLASHGVPHSQTQGHRATMSPFNQTGMHYTWPPLFLHQLTVNYNINHEFQCFHHGGGYFSNTLKVRRGQKHGKR